jgi:PKD repeat protein
MKKWIVILSLISLLLLVGTVSADTLLVYASNSSSVRNTSTLTAANILNGIGNTIVASGGGGTIALSRLTATTTSGYYNQLATGVYIFNTSSIPDTATINSATFGLYTSITTAPPNGLGNTNLTLVNFTPASYTSFVASDFDRIGTVRIAQDKQRADYTLNSYFNFTLNNEGLSRIDKTGFTSVATKLAWHTDKSTSGLTWASGANTAYSFYDVSGGAGKVPLLEVVYTPAAPAPIASFTLSKNFIRIPNSVTATDTSTNTPTSWEWSWGDGTANSTTQNPSHQYTKRGKWDIVMTATNAGGSSTTAATAVRVTGYENYYN